LVRSFDPEANKDDGQGDELEVDDSWDNSLLEDDDWDGELTADLGRLQKGEDE
jgi:hypothetical protein